jgi:type IV secretory pathway TrbD component
MAVLSIFGDVLWILALSIMASASRTAWARMAPETRVPMQFALNGAPTWRLKRNLALVLVPAVAFVVGIVLVLANREIVAQGGPNAVIIFGLRATVAALFAVLHLRWLRAALNVLEGEGALRP